MNFLILGMPNVGKTSIYNLITESNYNIIHVGEENEFIIQGKLIAVIREY